MSSFDVDIGGIDKVYLLKGLFEATMGKKDCRLYSLDSESIKRLINNTFNYDEAAKAVKGHINSFQGRYINCDLSGDRCNPSNYNKCYGKGKFEFVVSLFKERNLVDLFK